MKILVIGGGASGMLAALTAAAGGHQVTILERQARLGRKLLATGNGRCNLTNTDMSPSHFHGAHQEFLQAVLNTYDQNNVLAYFHELGLLTVTEGNGRVYPLSDQAGSVVDVLRFALDVAGVDVRTGCEVSELKKVSSAFHVTTNNGCYTADRVIVCCGGAAGGKLGGGNWGYELLKSMGHSLTALHPALVQIRTDPTFVRSLKGVRADGRVSVRSGKIVLAESAGEIQFTEFGVSGPAVFEVSRVISTASEPLMIHLDLLRSLNTYQTEKLLAARSAAMPNLTTENLLTGMLQNRLGRTIVRYAGFDLNTPLSALRPRELKKIAGACKDFRLSCQGTNGFEQAQVTAGGIRTSEFKAETLESRLVPGLYAAGEVLDADGDCGGYNLQWAWSSGHLAGLLL